MTGDEIVLHREPVEHIPVVMPQETSDQSWRFECNCRFRGDPLKARGEAINDARDHVRAQRNSEPRYVDEAGNEWRQVTP